MRLSKESVVLILLSLIDLLATLVLLQLGYASEGNPFMAFFLSYGSGVFVLTKLALTGAAVLILEWCRQYRPHFVSLMVKSAIATYVVVYVSLFAAFNVGW